VIVQNFNVLPKINLKKNYKNIFILESVDAWGKVSKLYDKDSDLVLSYDFQLKIMIENLGGEFQFIDYTCSQEVMQSYNSKFYTFFQNWFVDKNGEDIFISNGVYFGRSFRLDLWNDLIYYVRLCASLEFLSNINFQKIYLYQTNDKISEILLDMNLDYALIISAPQNSVKYYFPIHDWIDEKIFEVKLRYFLRDLIANSFGFFLKKLFPLLKNKKTKTIFLQEYYPTRSILRALKKNKNVDLLLAHYSFNSGFMKFFREILVPRPIFQWRVDKKCTELLEKFNRNRQARFFLINGREISSQLYHLIDLRLEKRLQRALALINGLTKFFEKVKLDLVVLIANIGEIPTIVDCIAEAKGIPSYLIINGLMSGKYLDESRRATYINSYSESIRVNYYKGSRNVYALGDPRMDSYFVKDQVKPKIRSSVPTITIGASAYCAIDMNSYVAIEFAFMHDVLSTLRNLQNQGYLFKVLIKTRSNGYKNTYKAFVDEYFPGFVSDIIGDTSISEVLKGTDFYISTYSQTLFEASCMGIPVLYYKKDTEIVDPPFDTLSELVTASSLEDLMLAIQNYFQGGSRYSLFLTPKIMEKYIGFLDGKNLERNLNFIYKILDSQGSIATPDVIR
jgi:hypothetical protein